MVQGWISLYRKIRESEIWCGKEPFDKRSAWIDLLLSANHEDKNIIFGSTVTPIKKGSFITSELKLSERWKWSRHKVDDYLKLLKKLNMILLC